ncbi:hypothetical protein [Mycolicibacterium iranicum]|uniref:EF-hand domain-containing protein n=1 Tax=Mycolicibacterium iranicum TaxID=912594 RepID=A0ABT4HQ93_MYCIR|nr:hypothetical protein [Mycolicibacterium iranicum]MCZ0732214.1 hypothetical protein [Mycolicibacterium iranicum]
MTQPATPAADPTTPPAEPEDTTPPDQQPDNEPEPTPNSEAARYRVQRNEARTERDALAERVAGYQRRECEQLIGDLLAQPGDLWDIARADVADFFDEDGTVEKDEVIAAAKALLEQRPGLAKDPTSGQPKHLSWGQHSAPQPGGTPGWQQVIGAR